MGLSLGPAGFVAILLAPKLAEWPSWARWGAILALLVAWLVLHFRPFPMRWSSLFRGSSFAFGVVVLISPWLGAMPAPARHTLAATVWIATWWISVAIPIAATSLLPLVLFPALGVMPSGAVAGAYANNNIFLFMGGFIIALGIQRWGLHRRIALHIVRVIGTNPTLMVLGFMVASAFLSMWISNTATTMMMLPIALAVIASFSTFGAAGAKRGFAVALLLGVAHASSIGGLATPIGTPPNISFLRITEILYPAAPGISFGQWMLAFLPVALVFLPVAWFIITRIHRSGMGSVSVGREVIREQIKELGPMSRAERRMLVVFGLTALLWITRKDLELGSVTIYGWSGFLERWIGPPFSGRNIHDATVAVAMAVLTFVIPGDPDDGGNPRPLMDWRTAVKLPWGILLLFGGGFALALAFKESGLSAHLGGVFASQAREMGAVGQVGASCALLSFLTEVTSNTATTEVMLPILSGTADAMGTNPLVLMLPATLSASCAFMLPIATPPNAIVFGSGKVTIGEMIKTGILLNLAGIAIVTAFFFLISGPLLGIGPGVPDWVPK